MRIKITLPEESCFKTDIAVRVGDVNYGGHLGNDSLLAFCHEARVRLFHAISVTEDDVGGVGIIMADAAVVYLAEAFVGDLLETELFASDWGRCGFDLYYLFTRKKDRREIARAKTGIVFFDYQAKKVAKTPADFQKRLRGLL